jgi:glycosyltransferase involved in cell wall biosynthesis
LAGSLKWGAYSVSEIFVLPSRQENFAITVAEAMHMARPVIISDRVNTACHVSSASSGLILSESACEDNLHEAVLTLLLDRGLAEDMGERGRTYAGTNLTWAKTAGEMLQCYREVLAGRV